MRCLYCDRPLALLKRLTGDGEFCSKEHRRIYQKEHNQLGLARLLEAQSGGKGQQHPVNPQTERPPAPRPPAPAAKSRDERQPQCAGFQSDFLREASAVSDANRLTGGPRFQGGGPVLAEPAQESEDRSKAGPRPKAAAFLSETPPLFFAGELRFPGKSVLEPLAGRPRLFEEPSAAGMAPRPRPKGAGFAVEQPVAPIRDVRASESSARRPAEPCFRPLAPANMSGLPHVRRDPTLPLAAFLPAAAVRANEIPDRIHRVAAEPRWKPLATVAPTQPTGKIIQVLVSFLRRPVRIASQDTLAESFRIRLQPISFPQYAPRMAILEERLHKTDRIGFTPP